MKDSNRPTPNRGRTTRGRGKDFSATSSNLGVSKRANVVDRPNEEPLDVDQLRNSLLGEIEQNYSGNTSEEDLFNQYKDSEKLKSCVLDTGGTHETILHWLVTRVGFLDHNTARNTIKAAWLMVRLAMEYDKELIARPDKLGKTALFQAINTKSVTVSELANAMCKYGEESKEFFRQAISHATRQGENCLHAAITQGHLELAKFLTSFADEKAFKQPRNCKEEDRNLDHGLNTPLHDAVEFRRLVFQGWQCAQDTDCSGRSLCDSCLKAMEPVYEHAEMVVDLVKTLVEKCDEALKLKNVRDESPYMYHISTKEAYDKKRSSVDSVGQNFGLGNVNPFASTGQVVQQPSNTASRQGGRQSCSRKEYRKEAELIEEYLEESAFSIGGFEDACCCFFGDATDEDGRSWPFRPGYPITSSADKLYEKLVREGATVLSHVDLCLDRGTAPANTAGSTGLASSSTGNLEDTPNSASREHRAEEINSWKKRTEALVKVFRMLRNRGVKRILKVTVVDDQRRPCSDSVILRCLQGFNVRYLDWNKQDLCIDVVRAACPKVAELTLYWSGRRSVLSGWTASSGLCGLNQLTKVNFNAKRGLEEPLDFSASVNVFCQEVRQHVFLARWGYCFALERGKARDYELALKKEIEEEEEKHNGRPHGTQGSPEDEAYARNHRRNFDFQIRRVWNTKQRLESQHQDALARAKNALSAGGDGSGCQQDQPVAPAVAEDDGEEDAGDSEEDAGYDSATPTEVGDGPSDDEYAKPPLASDTIKLEHCVDINYKSHYISWVFELNRCSVEGCTDGQQERGAGVGGYHPAGGQTEATHRWLKMVDDFLKGAEQSMRQDDSKPGQHDKNLIRVALIDDGVDVAQFQGSDMLRYPGWPPVPPTSEAALWNYSDTGHGTKMAKLIQRMCPKVQLFVAKLGGLELVDKSDSARRAKEAVRWAMSQDVHIISMSWSLIRTEQNEEDIKDLEKMIQKAANAGIIMYCAAADNLGPYIGKATKLYPHSADTKHIRVVGSSTEPGNASRHVDQNQVNYLFPGEDIPELGGSPGGSSAATAIAAGFAALLLWCVSQERSTGGSKSIDPARMHSIFRNLSGMDKKLVNVANVLRNKGGVATVKQVAQYCDSMAIVGD